MKSVQLHSGRLLLERIHKSEVHDRDALRAFMAENYKGEFIGHA